MLTELLVFLSRACALTFARGGASVNARVLTVYCGFDLSFLSGCAVGGDHCERVAGVCDVLDWVFSFAGDCEACFGESFASFCGEFAHDTPLECSLGRWLVAPIVLPVIGYFLQCFLALEAFRRLRARVLQVISPPFLVV